MSALKVEVVPCGDPSWNDRLELVRDDVYHGAGYHRFAQDVEGSRAFMIDVRDGASDRGLVWPYLLRSLSAVPELRGAEGSDITSVYGYPGPLAWGCEPGDRFMVAANEVLANVWRDQGAITAFTRFNPVLGNVRWGADLPLGGPDGHDPLLSLGETVGIDLRLDDAGAVAAYRKKLRQDVGRARRSGMTTHHDETWSRLDTFSVLYEESMIRNGADPRYLYSADQFLRLKAELGSQLHLFVSEIDGEVAAAGLFTEHRGIVQAHLVGTSTRYLALSPLKLLLDDVRSWARGRDNAVMHLGGGRAARSDPLFAFKARFSPVRYRFWVGRWIVDPVAYAKLCSTLSSDTRDPERPHQLGAYFPAYRAPPDAASYVAEPGT